MAHRTTAPDRLQSKLKHLSELLHRSEDFTHREFTVSGSACSLVYIQSLVDKEKIERLILRPLLNEHPPLAEIMERIPLLGIKTVAVPEEIVRELLQGSCVMLIEQQERAYSFQVKASQTRSVAEPSNEVVIRGSHEGFVEDLDTNMLLIRERHQNERLVLRQFFVGKTRKQVLLLHIEGSAEPEAVNAVTRKIEGIDQNRIHSHGDLLSEIEGDSFSVFPLAMKTERPDRVNFYLKQGRCVVLVDGSPSAIVVPVNFFAFFQSPDDYNTRWWYGSLYFGLRLFGFIFSMILPGLYISVIQYHFEILPEDLIFSLQSSIELIPYGGVAEALFMVLILELLREASIRLPTRIAQTIGIVGGLVIGTEVVNAHLVSTTMIVIIALTAIASYTATSYEIQNTSRLLTLLFTLSAELYGLPGMMTVLTIALLHLCRLQTFGMPYLFPLSPSGNEGFVRTFIIQNRLFQSVAERIRQTFGR
ncbi:spore germination protein [Cohnella suwonensis]|uniref:Spore germination protein n=1 Tax=Cohnella suwonensis TaxID=696072 RepID=A0ABW0LSP1_9BACL